MGVSRASEKTEKEGRHLLILEVLVNLLLVGIAEAVLVLVVAVAKVVAVAGRSEGVAVRVVGGLGAAVRGPDEGGGVLGLAVAGELGKGDVEEILVGGGLLGGADLDHVGASLRSRGEGRDGGEEGDEG